MRGFIYRDEIEDLPSREAGRGWQLEEQLRPDGFSPEKTLFMSARGRLETGGQFSFTWFYRAAVPNPMDQSSATVLESVFDLTADLPSLTPPPPAHPPHLLCLIHPHLPMCQP